MEDFVNIYFPLLQTFNERLLSLFFPHTSFTHFLVLFCYFVYPIVKNFNKNAGKTFTFQYSFIFQFK